MVISPELHIARTAPEQHSAALDLLFRHFDLSQRTALVGSILDEVRASASPLDGLLSAHRDGRFVGSVWAQSQSGATAVLWPPGLIAGEPEQTATKLLAAADAHLRSIGVVMSQALFEDVHAPGAEWLTQAGYQHLADLLYLAAMGDSLPAERPATRLDFEPYNTSNHARLATIVEQTYLETRDCPQLNGVRQIDDVLQGYRATGVFAPQRWRIVRQGDRDVGCLLMADHPGTGHWELVYMGLIPEVRGRGLGIQIARYGQWLARQAGSDRVVLAVDRDNGPARAMYEQVGFVAWDRRSVLLKVFDSEDR